MIDQHSHFQVYCSPLLLEVSSYLEARVVMGVPMNLVLIARAMRTVLSTGRKP